MKIVYLGGQTAGLIGYLTLKSLGHTVSHVVAYDWMVGDVAFAHGSTVCARLSELTKTAYRHADLLVCVHGREIVPPKALQFPKYGGINLHPCLWKYKGAKPIARALEAGEPRMSVGVHRMTADVDQGEVLWERFVPIPRGSTVEQVYQALYPFYVQGITHGIHEILSEEIWELEMGVHERNQVLSEIRAVSNDSKTRS